MQPVTENTVRPNVLRNRERQQAPAPARTKERKDDHLRALECYAHDMVGTGLLMIRLA
ncbi:MAG: hypothetical protein ACE14L_11635 [Terriglobales bacterium]